jgi:hypothetical protein
MTSQGQEVVQLANNKPLQILPSRRHLKFYFDRLIDYTMTNTKLIALVTGGG